MGKSCRRMLVGLALFAPGLAFGQLSTDFLDNATSVASADCRLSTVTTNVCPVTGTGVAVPGGLAINVPVYTQVSAGFPIRRVAPSVYYQRRPGVEDYFNATTTDAVEARACSCDTGSILATRSMIDLCKKALDVDPKYDFLLNHRAYVKTTGVADAAGQEATTLLACEAITEAGNWTLTITNDNFDNPGSAYNGKCGFRVVKGAGADSFVVQDDPPCKVIGNWAASNAGNTVATDMLREMVFQVDPAETEGGARVEGLVSITAVPLVGSPVSIAPVDTTGKTLEAIQDEIVTKLGLLPIGLEVRKGRALPDSALHGRALLDSNGRGQADDKLHFRKGGDVNDNFPIVHIRNAGAKLLRLEIKGQAGQFVGQSTQDITPAIPTLGEWGMLVLTLLLLASGYYLIRRRRVPASA